MHTTGDETNDIIFSRSEFLSDINPVTSTTFQNIYSAQLNPGLPASFPWLSQIACYFEEYEWVQLIYEVRSMVTEGNTNASGTIVHATQYNPSNGLFTSKQKMENYEFAQSHKVTDHGQHGVECDPDKRSGSASEYIRTGEVPVGQDIKTYDLGVYQLAVCNTGATAVNLGELWVHYTVKLKKTKIVDPGAVSNVSAPYWTGASTQTLVTALAVPTVIAPTAGIMTALPSNFTPTFSGGATTTTPLVVTLPATFQVDQVYEIVLAFAGATAVTTTPLSGLVMTGTNCNVTTFALQTGSVASALTGVIAYGLFQPTGGGIVKLTIAPGTVLPSSGSCYWKISLATQIMPVIKI
jgi:hypothetical protein